MKQYRNGLSLTWYTATAANDLISSTWENDAINCCRQNRSRILCTVEPLTYTTHIYSRYHRNAVHCFAAQSGTVQTECTDERSTEMYS